ncbi:endoplasmic reticulum-based factor for assembly of V-ATPase-domain-containing protein [Pyronema domesticum]|uniref:Similar to Vacuolar ATPase assembly integral membrane protein vph2 acc. no. O74920 n=1 Tax=Pyronema omphalodes (strain CBS 100304) TaxID=1076935 RepID=U4LUQ7_PYROM|nr:endoplasmic reticulum-based factor for assembly of V-ATPase-domain-containing protein [Pyronema domesticum]CCX33922.1 Similar to Vacuolar ATPase assembly integral membrane protein vph2; acc. no. O74920 [Pyronema omphalodes CBS 100304]
MVLLTTTPRIHSALTAYNALPSVDSPLSAEECITHTDLRLISQSLISRSSDYSYAALLRGSSVYTPPPPPPPPKTPEYIALMKRLRQEAEEREYRGLTTEAEEVVEEEMTWKEVKSQISVIFNVMLSVFATAAAVWKVAESWDAPERLAAAFASAILVGVAEVVLFMGYVRRLDQGKKVEGKKKDVASIKAVWEVGVDGVKARVTGN